MENNRWLVLAASSADGVVTYSLQITCIELYYIISC